MVTAEKSEALEEVLWMAFFPQLHDPAVSNVLDGRVQHPEFESFFADHMRKLILARDGQRYVSKNNYNVTRLGYPARFSPTRVCAADTRAARTCRIAREAAPAFQSSAAGRRGGTPAPTSRRPF